MQDYVIVGAGSAGCVLAARLSEDPTCRVLLLEAGPSDRKNEVRIPAAFSKLFHTERDWDYHTTPQEQAEGREMFWPRGRMLGGSSSMNAMMWVRGNRRDFDGWAALGNLGWAYDDVLPAFRRSEDSARGGSEHRGTGGPITVSELRDPNPMTHAFVDAAVAAGIPRAADVNGAEQDGVGYTQVTQRRGARCSTSSAYLRPARRRKNLEVRTGAQATRVLLDGTRAVGVEYRVDGRRETATADREAILAGGAVNSPQLLMLSGIGPAEQLRAHGIEPAVDLSGVGQNLQDHLAVCAIALATQPISLVSAESPGNLARYLLRRKGMLTSNVAEGVAFVRTAPGLPAPDIELVFAPVPFIDHGLVTPPGHGLTVGAVLLRPKSRGAVTLASGDPFVAPRIDPEYFTDPDDVRVLVEGVRMARRVLRTEPLASFAGDDLEPSPGTDDDGLEAFVREQAETLYHPVGTCRMGIDADAVVDPSLRVHGTSDLRVVDASVMPTIPGGHTNASTIMIAERAAELVRAAAE